MMPDNLTCRKIGPSIILLCAAAIAMLAGAPIAAQPAKPNIIFILADDLGYGEVGCYGQEKIKTPTLDKMAAEGARFTDFYSGAPVCAPARCTLLTGYHTGHAFIRGNGNPPLPADSPSLGVLLQKNGYHTGCIGKWGMGPFGSSGSPTAQGFDEFVGFISQVKAHQQYPESLFYNDTERQLPQGTYANDVFTSEAVDFVKRNGSKSFFLYLPYTIPHQRLEVPSQGIYANEVWPENEKNKAAMITRMDAGIGALLTELQRQGIDENTLVMFTSDNGPHREGSNPAFFNSAGPFRGIKRDLTEGGIRVPMIARWPGQINAGTVSSQVWANWDVLPTLLDIADIQDDTARDGISLKPALLENKPVDHGPLYWEFYERGFAQAVRDDNWKLLRTTTGSLELYDLANDPGERSSLSASRPDIVTQMMPMLTSMRVPSETWLIRYAPDNKGKKPKPGAKKRGGKKRNNAARR